MRTGLNRVLLVFSGIVLLVGGGVGLACGFGALGASAQHRRLVSDALRHTLLTAGWWWPAVYAALGVLIVASLAVLLLQFRRDRLPTARLEGADELLADPLADDLEPWPGGGHTLVAGGAVADAVADEAEQLDGVVRARARLVGSSREPRLELSLMLTPDTEVDRVLDELEAGPLANVAAGLGVAAVPALVTLSSARATTRRTR